MEQKEGSDSDHSAGSHDHNRPWQCSGQLLVLPSRVLGQLGASVEQGELHTCLTPYTKSMLDARQIRVNQLLFL